LFGGLKMLCPKCGCPFARVDGWCTADAYQAWQDTDGTWYKGPAKETTVSTGDGCGRKETKIKARGKLVSHEVTGE
jgi:hypothetical protein